jgi:hypothetical protein
MLKTTHGSDDGIAVRSYLAGLTYTLPDTPRGKELAAVFLREKWAEEDRPVAPVVVPPASAPVAPLAQPATPSPVVPQKFGRRGR